MKQSNISTWRGGGGAFAKFLQSHKSSRIIEFDTRKIHFFAFDAVCRGGG